MASGGGRAGVGGGPLGAAVGTNSCGRGTGLATGVAASGAGGSYLE